VKAAVSPHSGSAKTMLPTAFRKDAFSPSSIVRNTGIFTEYIFAVVSTVAVTAASLLIEPVAGHATPSIYLLLVVIAGLRLSRGPVLCVAAASTIAWYTIFIPPRFSFHIGTLDDLMIFASFFAVAMAMGHLTSQLRLKEMSERMRERRTAALYELVRQAALAPDLERGLRAAVNLIEDLFGVRAALLVAKNTDLAFETEAVGSFQLDEREYAGARDAFRAGAPVGKFTGFRAELSALHLPLRSGALVKGVLSIEPTSGVIFDSAQRELLDALAMLIATVVEKDELLQTTKQSEIIAASERLQRALLQSVSHELKTPLAAVQAGFDALAKEAGVLRTAPTVVEIQRAIVRLRRVINNLLDMTRIESRVVHPKLDWCDVGEMIEAATDLAKDAVGEHPIVISLDPQLPMVRLDQALIEQCICNLLLNAAANSPSGSKIQVTARIAEGALTLSVQDRGPGIRENDLPRIFEIFYRGAQSKPGGTGLGLAIVDGFIRAHGGCATAANREPCGAEFVITVPVEILTQDLMEKFA